MAIKTTGFDDFFDDLKDLGEDVDNIINDMLTAGADITVEEWKAGIRDEPHKVKGKKGYISKNGFVDTGDMENAVAGTLEKGNKAEIYPRGTDRKGVRNATKAYVLHYGTSSIPPSRFVDKIEDKAAPEVYSAMENVMDKYIIKHGL